MHTFCRHSRSQPCLLMSWQVEHSVSLQAPLRWTSHRAALGAPRGLSSVCFGCVLYMPGSVGDDSALFVRSLFLPPINRCSAAAVLATQAGSNVSSGRAVKRRHSVAASTRKLPWSSQANGAETRTASAPGATDATMSDRVSRCHGSASELSQSISDASMSDAEKKRVTRYPLRSTPCRTAWTIC